MGTGGQAAAVGHGTAVEEEGAEAGPRGPGGQRGWVVLGHTPTPPRKAALPTVLYGLLPQAATTP